MQLAAMDLVFRFTKTGNLTLSQVIPPNIDTGVHGTEKASAKYSSK